MVGARPGPGSFLTVFSYLFAAWLLMVSFLSLLDGGALRLTRPDLFARIMTLESSGQDTQKLKVLAGVEGTYAIKALSDSDQEWREAIQTPGLLWIGSMAALRGVVTFAWIIIAWGALGNLLGMSRSRAIFSFAIFLGLGSIAVLLGALFQMAPIMVDTGRWLEKWSY
jgi:hypothetical protein